MACNGNLLTELTDLANQIGCNAPPCECCVDPGCCDAACCYPTCNFPFAQVTMSCPPPILAPTSPQPVKPLQLPCPFTQDSGMSAEEGERTRYDNFYNNYNLDWHSDGTAGVCKPREQPPCTGQKERGQTVDGKSPCCDECIPDRCPPPGCPTGFKPCTMKLTPPPCCHPHGVWCAEIQPCASKPKKKGPLRPSCC